MGGLAFLCYYESYAFRVIARVLLWVFAALMCAFNLFNFAYDAGAQKQWSAAEAQSFSELKKQHQVLSDAVTGLDEVSGISRDQRLALYKLLDLRTDVVDQIARSPVPALAWYCLGLLWAEVLLLALLQPYFTNGPHKNLGRRSTDHQNERPDSE